MASQWERLKWLPSDRDARFLVDGFNFATPACATYFLTHFHSDHYTGLTRSFCYGTVYASEVTARLLVHDFGLPERCVRALPMGQAVRVEGCEVTLLDANHCPGAAMLLVRVVADAAGRPLPPPHATILHTGDMRWADWMASQIPRGVRVGTLYLDTTYAQPRYTFPPQGEVVGALAGWVARALAVEPATLLVVGAYHIGKERLFLGLARALRLRVWCSGAKRRVLALLALAPEDEAVLTDDPGAAQIHVVAMGLRPAALEARYLLPAPGAPAAAPGAPALGQEPSGARASPDNMVEADPMAPGPVQPPAASPAGNEEEGGEAGQEDSAGGSVVEVVELCEGEGEGEQSLAAAGWGDEGGGRREVDAAEQEVEAAAADAVRGRWARVVGIRATGWTFRRKARSLLSVWAPKGWDQPGAPPPPPPPAAAAPPPAAPSTAAPAAARAGRSARGGRFGGSAGWQLTTGRVALVSAPYSEHSSYAELCACVAALRPHTLVPTVNAGSAAAARALVDRFAPLMDLSRDKSRMDAYLRRPPPAAGHQAGAARVDAAAQASAPALIKCEPEPPHAAVQLSPRSEQAVAGVQQVGARERAVQLQEQGDAIDLTEGGDDAMAGVDVREQARIWALIQAQNARELARGTGTRAAVAAAAGCAASQHPPAPTASSRKRGRGSGSGASGAAAAVDLGPGSAHRGVGTGGPAAGRAASAPPGQASLHTFFTRK